MARARKGGKKGQMFEIHSPSPQIVLMSDWRQA